MKAPSDNPGKTSTLHPHTLLDPQKTGRGAAALEAGLRNLIVGQDEAVQQIVSVYQMHLTGLGARGRPIGSFLFLGPTGSGKTRIVEATAEVLLDNPGAVIKVDCAEFQHSHEIAKLIGSPPGYLGHRETLPLLCQEILNRYHTENVNISFVLFDEIEKASDALWNLLLGILDKATLTLGDNRRVDFSDTMIFMTSNLGAAQMSAIMRPRLGFASGAPQACKPEKISEAALEAVRRKFTPEFVNRIDKIVVFNSLGEAELRRVLGIELHRVQRRIFADCASPFGFTLTEGAREHLLSEGTDQRYGARYLKRAIERYLIQPMSNLVASGQLSAGDWLSVDFETQSHAMIFVKESEGMPASAMAARAGAKLSGGKAAQRGAGVHAAAS